MKKTAKIFIAGKNGMVGSAIFRHLKSLGFENLICPSSKELDLRDQTSVANFFTNQKPNYVFLAAAKVGGIQANINAPAQFIYDNLMIESNVIHQAYLHGVDKLLFLGSSCIYPKFAPQPIPENSLLTSPLEPTNEYYAIAKIAGLKLCEAYRKEYGSNFIALMPTNLYGPNDNYDLENSHVLPALLRKFHEAKINAKPFVEIWGDGSAFREFMHVSDLASACVFLMENYNESEIINVGTGKDISIKTLAQTIKEVVEFDGKLIFDKSKPKGTPRKLLNIDKLKNLGFEAKINLKEGIKMVYENFKEEQIKL